MNLVRRLLLLMPFVLVGVAHAGQADSDHDGVADAVDKCPGTAQLKMLPPDFKYKAAVNPERLKGGARAHPVDKFGCELDNDHDGVVNSADYCPDNSKLEISKGVASNGCPVQSDADGTPDYRDHCPGTPRHVATDRFGCPKKKEG
jgi:OOP family OmpA-OmpF porin